MKKLRNCAIFLFSFLLTIIVCTCLLYNFMLMSVDKKDDKEVLFEIKMGESSKEIAKNLYDENLIRSDKVFLVYLKLNGVTDIKSGFFNLKKSMNVENIVDTIRKNSNLNPNSVNILFKEGLTIPGIANTIAQSTNNSYDDVINVINNDEYIDTLIEKYSFLTDDIKNDSIYYSLEGYLYPDTYNFDNKDVSVEEILERMLDKEKEVLDKYKADIENSNYTIHEILTLASITENEGIKYEDKQNIVSVFENRLAKGMNLGSDVTTYYAAQVNMGDRDLTVNELNMENPYNTRGPNMEGKLPVGPICNPSEQTIKAVINANETDYLYFVADKDRNVYFTKTVKEHDNMVAKLKDEGLWYEW